MAYEVRTERVDARPLASVRSSAPRAQLGAEIRRLLDQVWPAIREQGVRPGQNVVVYHGVRDVALLIEAGVETLTAFADHGPVRRSATPDGEVATTTHLGDYSGMAPAYAALEEWCSANGRRPSAISWEVYGDWEEDPAKLRTDIYFLLTPR